MRRGTQAATLGTKGVSMSIVKTLRFAVQARWFGGRLVRLGAHQKPPLRIATRRGVPLHTLEVGASGHLERGTQGYHFTVVELDVELATDPGREPEAEELARLAKEHCIVGRALEVPVHVRIVVRALEPASVEVAG